MTTQQWQQQQLGSTQCMRSSVSSRSINCNHGAASVTAASNIGRHQHVCETSGMQCSRGNCDALQQQQQLWSITSAAAAAAVVAAAAATGMSNRYEQQEIDGYRSISGACDGQQAGPIRPMESCCKTQSLLQVDLLH